MTATWKTVRVQGSRTRIDPETLASMGWPSPESGKHRERRGRVHVRRYLRRLPVWNHPWSPLILAGLMLLLIPIGLALGIGLLAGFLVLIF